MVKKKMASGGAIVGADKGKAKGYAAGGSAKARKNFPMTKKAPAKKGK